MNFNKYVVFFISWKNLLMMLFVVILLLASFFLENLLFNILATILFLLVVLYAYKTKSKERGEFELYMNKVYTDISMASKSTMLMLSIPTALFDVDGNAIWKNSFFQQMFKNKQEESSCISGILSRINQDNSVSEQEIEDEVFVGENFYVVKGKLLKKFSGKEKDILLIYFFDNTELYNLVKVYTDEKSIVGVVVIDNYDDMMKSMDDSKKPQMIAEIDAKLLNWFSFTGGVIKKFERDKYILFFEHRYLKIMEDKKFEILDFIKEIDHGNKISVTLSIGISNLQESLGDNLNSALASLEIALGRGGDQVVLKDDERITFYGGKSQEVEKRTKVKVRVIGNALVELMKQAGQIIIMGHVNCDIDCLGAAMGVYKIGKSLGKESYIILGESTPTISPFIKRISASDRYDGVFVEKSKAIDMMNKKTLLIVVDTHRPSYTEVPEILKMTENVIVIDHHRRGLDFITDAALTYHEPYASSTCELITEIIQYIESSFKENNVELTSLESELLYSGIVVDTKEFTFKTGVRTFEAAAYLRDHGVDTIQVKRMLQNDLESYLSISNIVKNVEVINGNIAFSICKKEMKNVSLVVAQAADEILNISGIEASFVISYNGQGVTISGRSLGRINVQVILEKIGGGGHQSVAGAQFQDKEIGECVKELKNAINDYLSEIDVSE